MASPKYDVALSFAGEDREFVAKAAGSLKARGIKVFYDDFEKVQLWGKDLYEHFLTVYRDESFLVVIFVSRHYAEKSWTRHELRAAQARALVERSEYILPAQLDDTILERIPQTTAYISLKGMSPEDFASLVAQKVAFARVQPLDGDVNTALRNLRLFSRAFDLSDGVIEIRGWIPASHAEFRFTANGLDIQGILHEFGVAQATNKFPLRPKEPVSLMIQHLGSPRTSALATIDEDVFTDIVVYSELSVNGTTQPLPDAEVVEAVGPFRLTGRIRGYPRPHPGGYPEPKGILFDVRISGSGTAIVPIITSPPGPGGRLFTPKSATYYIGKSAAELVERRRLVSQTRG